MRQLFQIAAQNKADLLAFVFMLIGLGLPLALFTFVETWGMQ